MCLETFESSLFSINCYPQNTVAVFAVITVEGTLLAIKTAAAITIAINIKWLLQTSTWKKRISIEWLLSFRRLADRPQLLMLLLMPNSNPKRSAH